MKAGRFSNGWSDGGGISIDCYSELQNLYVSSLPSLTADLDQPFDKCTDNQVITHKLLTFKRCIGLNSCGLSVLLVLIKKTVDYVESHYCYSVISSLALYRKITTNNIIHNTCINTWKNALVTSNEELQTFRIIYK